MNINNHSDEQAHQENEYCFPYHYIAQYGPQRFSQSFCDSWGINYVSTIEFILQQLSELPSAKIVDIGCGDGRLTQEIRNNIPAEIVTGIDYSKKAIKLAQAMNQDVQNINFIFDDITNPTTNLGTYDAAILMEVFEHIPIEHAENFISSVKQLIKPGGHLLLTVPHINKVLEYKHFQHFSVESIRKYLEPHFEIVSIIPFERRSLLRPVLNTVLHNKLFTLNNKKILNKLYHFYKKHLFLCGNEKSCQRIYINAKAK